MSEAHGADAMLFNRLKICTYGRGRPALVTLARYAASEQPSMGLPDAAVNVRLSGKPVMRAGDPQVDPAGKVHV